MTSAIRLGNPDAGSLCRAPAPCFAGTGRSDAGEIASEEPRRGALLSRRCLAAGVVFAGVLAAIPASAEKGASGTNYGSDFITKTASDSGTDSGFTNASWSDGQVPHRGAKYVLTSKNLRTPQTEGVHVFGDNGEGELPSLYIDVNPTDGCFQNPTRGDVAKMSYFDLHLVYGALSLMNCSAAWTNTNIEVVDPNFLVFLNHSTRPRWFLVEDSSVRGGETAGLRLAGRVPNAQTDDRGTYALDVRFNRCDFSEYLGSVTVGPEEGSEMSRLPTCLKLTSTSMPQAKVHLLENGSLDVAGFPGESLTLGEVTVETGASVVVPTSNAVSVAEATFRGGTLDFRACTETAVAQGSLSFGAFSHDGPIKVVTGYNHDSAQNSDLWTRLMTIPSSADVSEDDFEVVKNWYALPTVEMKFEDAETGKKTVSMRRYDVVAMWTSNSSAGGGSAFKAGNEKYWSDRKLPHSKADYIVLADLQLMTDEHTPVFPGNTWTFADGAKLSHTGGATVTASNLNFVAGSFLQAWKTGLAGNAIHVWKNGSKRLTVRVYPGTAFTIYNDIVGDGDLVCAPLQDKAQTETVVRLVGDNSGYRGRIRLDYVNGGNGFVPGEGKVQTLEFNSANALGGPLPAFAHDALEITQWQAIRPMEDGIVVNEPTRGVHFLGEACVDVPENMTLTFNQPATWSGRLVKKGKGTLSMGGSVKFTSDQLDDPTGLDGTNILEVVAGSVKPVSTNAFDGLELTFGQGSSLELDLDPSDPGVKDWGLHNVRSSRPFGSMTQIPVTIDPGGRSSLDGNVSIGICTVSSVAAKMMTEASFSIARIAKGMKVQRVSRRINANGSVTFVAEISRPGLVLVVR